MSDKLPTCISLRFGITTGRVARSPTLVASAWHSRVMITGRFIQDHTWIPSVKTLSGIKSHSQLPACQGHVQFSTALESVEDRE